MSGAWGKPLVQREQTDAEKQQAAAASAKAKADAAARALMQRAETLVAKIEASYETRDGGVSANYGSDEQYSVGGTWSNTEASMAFNLWKTRYAGQVVALNMHKLGPSEKTTGDRDGKWQFNFIRKMTSGTSGRYNIHVNWNRT